eukprot:1507137-Amphidinium_carterae.1
MTKCARERRDKNNCSKAWTQDSRSICDCNAHTTSSIQNRPKAVKQQNHKEVQIFGQCDLSHLVDNNINKAAKLRQTVRFKENFLPGELTKEKRQSLNIQGVQQKYVNT